MNGYKYRVGWAESGPVKTASQSVASQPVTLEPSSYVKVDTSRNYVDPTKLKDVPPILDPKLFKIRV